LQQVATNVLVALPAQFVAYVLCVGFMALVVRQKYHVGLFDAVRWNPPQGRWVYGAMALGVGLGLVNALSSGFLERWIPKSLPIEQLFSSRSSAFALAAFGIFIAPPVEELLFRGFLYPALARPLGSLLSVALTGGLFALIHSPQLAHAWIPLLLLFAVGVILTVVRAKTKSVATTVLIHMSYNTTLFVLVYVGTDGFRHLERM
jgi:membrane protease YdiL (CAAX protease family)